MLTVLADRSYPAAVDEHGNVYAYIATTPADAGGWKRRTRICDGNAVKYETVDGWVDLVRVLREGADAEYAHPKSSELRSLIEQYLRDHGYHMTTVAPHEWGDTWGNPELGEGRTFEQVVRWQIGRELEGRDTPRDLRRELIAELSEQAATYEDERIARLLLRASEEIVLLAGRLTQIAAQKVAAPVGKPSVWDIARELAGRSDPAKGDLDEAIRVIRAAANVLASAGKDEAAEHFRERADWLSRGRTAIREAAEFVIKVEGPGTAQGVYVCDKGGEPPKHILAGGYTYSLNFPGTA